MLAKSLCTDINSLTPNLFAAAFNLDLDEAAQRVYTSNMSKLGFNGKPIYREDGKVLKGPNYTEPNLFNLVQDTLK